MFHTSVKCCTLISVFLAGTLSGANALFAGPEQDYHRAYYLQNEGGDLEQAQALFEKAAKSRKLDKALAADAKLRARCCLEDLRSENLASIMPPDPLAYIELGSPGKHLGRLLGQLGLVRDDSWKLPENIKQKMARFAISPALLSELSEFRGVAVSVIGFDPMKQEPTVVVAIHPGDSDVLRGALETGIPAAGEPINPIRKTRVFKIENFYVALTPRLVIASQLRTEIDNALKRLTQKGVPSLADSEEFRSMQGDRNGRLLFACFNARQVMPLVSQIVQGAGGASQEFAIASALLDLDSLRWISMRAGVSDDAIAQTLTVRFDEDQNNLAYNFLRTPPLSGSSLKCVPSGAACFLAGALNEPTKFDPKRKADKAATIRRITGLDIGRELFANIEEQTLFLLPPGGEDAQTDTLDCGIAMPDVGLALTVRDPAASTALWTQLLSLPTFATGQPAPEGKSIRIAELEATVYEWPEGIKVYQAVVDNHVLVGLTQRALYQSVRAARGGDSILDDPAFKPAMTNLTENSSKVLFAHVGRALQVAKAVSGADMSEIEPFLPLFDKLVACFVTDESNSEFRITTAITGIPDISGVVEQLVAVHMTGQHADHSDAVAKAKAHKVKKARRHAPSPPAKPAKSSKPAAKKPSSPAAPEGSAPSAGSAQASAASPADRAHDGRSNVDRSAPSDRMHDQPSDENDDTKTALERKIPLIPRVR